MVGPPLWKLWKSIGTISNPIYGKITHGNQTTNQETIWNSWKKWMEREKRIQIFSVKVDWTFQWIERWWTMRIIDSWWSQTGRTGQICMVDNQIAWSRYANTKTTVYGWSHYYYSIPLNHEQATNQSTSDQIPIQECLQCGFDCPLPSFWYTRML